MSYQMPISPRSRKAGRFIGRVHSEIQNAFSKRSHDDGLTQQQLATLLDVDRSVVNKRLLGKANLTLRTIADFAWALDYGIEFRLVDLKEKRKHGNHQPKIAPDTTPPTSTSPSKFRFETKIDGARA